MARKILLLLTHAEDRRAVAEGLHRDYEVITPYPNRSEERSSPGGPPQSCLEAAFDLCILDRPVLERLGESVEKRKRVAAPEFLPFLLVTPKKEVALVARHPAAPVDELVISPVEESELRKRVEALLQARRLSRQQAVVAALGQKALASDNVQSVMDEGVKSVAEVLNAEYAEVLELLPGAGRLLLRAGAGWKEGCVGQAMVGAETTLHAGHILQFDDPVVIEDLRTESRFAGSPLLLEHGVVSGIGVAIRCRSGALGVLGVYSRHRRAFTKDDRSFLQSIAHALGAVVDRFRSQERILHLNRLLTTLLHINQLIVRETDRHELLRKACRILVEQGGFRMAWVGMADFTTDQVLPFAHAGSGRDWLEKAEIRCDESPQGRGPAGTAIRTGRRVVGGIETAPSFDSWRAEAGKQGYSSSAAFPLRLRGNVVGALSVYSGEREGFAEETVSLLDELVADIGFALQVQDEARLRKTAEDELRDSEARYRALVEQIPAVTYTAALDEASTTLYISPQVEKILGFSPAEFRADPDMWRKRLHPDDRERVLQEVARRRAAFEPFQCEYRMIARDGRTVWFRDAAQVMLDRTGRPVFLLGVMSDITDMRKAEEDIRHKAELLDAAGDSIFVLDADTNFLYANQAGFQLRGYTREEMRAMKLKDIVAPHYFPSVSEAIERLKKSGQARYESVHVRKDGTFMSVEVNGRAIEMGGQKQILLVERDVTAHKQGEEERDCLFNLSPNLLCVAGFDGYLKQLNPAWQKTLGWTKEELLARPYMDFIHLEDHEATRAAAASLAEGKTLNGFENRYICRDGSYRWISWDASPLVEQKLLYGVGRDVTDRRRAEGQVRQQVQRLSALRAIDAAINASLDLRVTLAVFLDQVTTSLGVDAADVLLLRPHSRLLEYAAGRGFRGSGVTQTRLRLGEGHAGCAAMERRVVHVVSLDDSPDCSSRMNLLGGEGFGSYHAVPLISKGQVKGVLEIYLRSRVPTDPHWEAFAESLAAQAAIGLDNAALFDEAQRANLDLHLAYDTTLEGWSRALDMRDKETEGHSQRVAEMAVSLARQLGVKDEEAVHIRRGALLHDVGKMAISDAILLKPETLTKGERAVIRMHPVYAYELLSPILFLRPALDIPYCHHENWDGSGYPRRLKGEQIPFAARIFAPIDAYDALLSSRPYRPAWTADKARQYIRERAGKQFDRAVAGPFLNMLEARG